MWSATAPLVHYTFLKEPSLQEVYWSLVSFTSPPYKSMHIIAMTDFFLRSVSKHHHLHTSLSQASNRITSGWRLWFPRSFHAYLCDSWLNHARVEGTVEKIPDVGSGPHLVVQYHRRNCLRPSVSRALVAAPVRRFGSKSPAYVHFDRHR